MSSCSPIRNRSAGAGTLSSPQSHSRKRRGSLPTPQLLTTIWVWGVLHGGQRTAHPPRVLAGGRRPGSTRGAAGRRAELGRVSRDGADGGAVDHRSETPLLTKRASASVTWPQTTGCASKLCNRRSDAEFKGGSSLMPHASVASRSPK